MSTATKILRNRIVLIFDFDGTLGPNTNRILFNSLDLDYEEFEQSVEKYEKEKMWQGALAKAEALRVYSHREGSRIRRQVMERVGEDFPLFEGVPDFVQRLKEYAAEQDEDITLEFVMLTAGFETIPAATSVAKSFDRIYGGELIFDEEGRILGAKRIITHADKVHYVKMIQEGIDIEKPSELENSYIEHDAEDHYVPMSQVIYVGDGTSDMSAFQAVEQNGGIAIAIDPDEGEWDGYEQMAPGRRVHNVARADYGPDSDMFRSLKLSVDRAIAEIKLLRMGEGE